MGVCAIPRVMNVEVTGTMLEWNGLVCVCVCVVVVGLGVKGKEVLIPVGPRPFRHASVTGHAYLRILSTDPSLFITPGSLALLGK